jgi:hypothetical protein
MSSFTHLRALLVLHERGIMYTGLCAEQSGVECRGFCSLFERLPRNPFADRVNYVQGNKALISLWYPLFHVIPKFVFPAEKFIETSVISALRVISKLREIGYMFLTGSG